MTWVGGVSATAPTSYQDTFCRQRPRSRGEVPQAQAFQRQEITAAFGGVLPHQDAVKRNIFPVRQGYINRPPLPGNPKRNTHDRLGCFPR